MVEEWRPVPGYEGSYEVSSEGRVRSIRREEYSERWGGYRTLSERIMKLQGNGNSEHLSVELRKERRRKSFGVHRLVMMAFVGPCPEGMEVMHADDDPTNNQLENLSYGTRAENVQQCVDRGRHSESRKTHCPRGHEYNEENTYLNPKGGRQCRACARERYREKRRRF